MAREVCPVLPQDVGLCYLAEGAANIVYHISVPYLPPDPQPTVLDMCGDGTPPPTEIDGDEEDNHYVELDVFKRKNFCYPL